MAREVFVDAGAWIAVANQRDDFHTEAAAFYARLLREKRLLVTTNLCVAEAHAMLRRHTGYRPAIGLLETLNQATRLTKVYADATLEAEAEKILRRYTDQDFSLTDAVSFAVMQQRGVTEAFGFDHHFVTAGFTVVPTI